MRAGRGTALLASALLLTACGTAQLPPEGGVDYQPGAAYEADLAIVVRDAGAAPLPGAYSLCYVNGFQTQPGQGQLWAEHPELLPRDAAGEEVRDPDWPDEILLNPSTPAQRAGILAVLSPVIAGRAEAGFDAVEIDNLDSFPRADGIAREDRAPHTILRDRDLGGPDDPMYVYEAC